MNNAGLALGCALAMAGQSCARVAPRRLALPAREAPWEQRAAYYHQHAAMPHMGFGGWAMRVGAGPVGELGDDRPYLANSTEAEDILHARDNQLALGWGFVGAGIAMILSSLAVIPLSYSRDSTDRDSFPVLPFALIGAGTLLSLPGVFISASAQRRVPLAAEAYNRWLWNALALPRVAPEGVLSPPSPPSAAAPWTNPR